MPRIPDLVRDSRLETRFHPEHTEHIYYESGHIARQRTVCREEHWKSERYISRGSYGTVWLEQCVKGEREVKFRAIKQIPKTQQNSKPIDYNRELEAIAKFSHRKYERCFVQSFGWYENAHAIFIAMEYIQHGDLQDYVSVAPPLPESEAQQVTFQILEGLFFMHENGFAHRDLKPRNILVKSQPPEDWWVKIGDFGISKRVDDDLAVSSTLKGTLGFLAPELHGFIETGKESSPSNAQAADMWCLGEIAFQILTKEPTFKNMGRLANYIQSPSIFPSTTLLKHAVSDKGQDFIKCIMRPTPQKRLTAAEALRHDWVACYTSSSRLSSSVSESPHIPREISTSNAADPLDKPSGRWSTTDIPNLQPDNLKTTQKVPCEHRLVIAIDYGTTFTGVAWAVPKTANANLDEIELVRDWGPGVENYHKIPSVISYSPTANSGLQWGASISEDAVVMENTKLELEIQDSKLDELDLILKALDGMNNLDFRYIKESHGFPDYTWKAPEDIITDYLGKVCQHLCQHREFPFGAEVGPHIPADIAITVPLKWSYRGKNSLFRAFRNAGFNDNTFPNLRDVIMVAESDAAAMYMARYLKENMERDSLKQGESFVLCDAGSETVEVMSYKITQLEPNLKLESAAVPTGAKCGSIDIDMNFKKWLHGLLGDRNYMVLDRGKAGRDIRISPIEGLEMRRIMRQFDVFKRKFAKFYGKIFMDLPNPFHNLNIDNKVRSGEVTITNEEMRSFFDPPVDGIIELIQSQIHQIERNQIRVRNIFLTGTFGESRYLQEQIGISMSLRKIQLWKPESGWTAVVRGAVIYGIEKSAHQNLSIVKTCPRSYGVTFVQEYFGSEHDRIESHAYFATDGNTAKGQLSWLIQKGDLLLPDTPIQSERAFDFCFGETDDRIFTLSIYECTDDYLYDRIEEAEEDLKKIAVLNCDLSRFPIDNFPLFLSSRDPPTYYVVHCICKLVLSGSRLTAEVMWDEILLCSTVIEVVTEVH